MNADDIDRVFGRGRLQMVTGDARRGVSRGGAAGRAAPLHQALPDAPRTATSATGPSANGASSRAWSATASRRCPTSCSSTAAPRGRPALVQTYDAGVTVDHWATLLPVERDGRVLRHVFEDCAHWWALAHHCLIALDAIHELHLVHLDLKADNVCIPIGPADFDPRMPGQALHPRFEQLALIDFAFSLVSGETLTTRAADRPPARTTTTSRRACCRRWRPGAAATCCRRASSTGAATCSAWPRCCAATCRSPAPASPSGLDAARCAQARALVRRLLEAHDAELPAQRPHAELIALASQALRRPSAAASLAQRLAAGARQRSIAAQSPTPVTRIALPVAATIRSARRRGRWADSARRRRRRRRPRAQLWRAAGRVGARRAAAGARPGSCPGSTTRWHGGGDGADARRQCLPEGRRSAVARLSVAPRRPSRRRLRRRRGGVRAAGARRGAAGLHRPSRRTGSAPAPRQAAPRPGRPWSRRRRRPRPAPPPRHEEQAGAGAQAGRRDSGRATRARAACTGARPGAAGRDLAARRRSRWPPAGARPAHRGGRARRCAGADRAGAAAGARARTVAAARAGAARRPRSPSAATRCSAARRAARRWRAPAAADDGVPAPPLPDDFAPARRRADGRAPAAHRAACRTRGCCGCCTSPSAPSMSWQTTRCWRPHVDPLCHPTRPGRHPVSAPHDARLLNDAARVAYWRGAQPAPGADAADACVRCRPERRRGRGQSGVPAPDAEAARRRDGAPARAACADDARPRHPDGRVEDWTTFAVASALTGRERDARNALFVSVGARAGPDPAVPRAVRPTRRTASGCAARSRRCWSACTTGAARRTRRSAAGRPAGRSASGCLDGAGAVRPGQGGDWSAAHRRARRESRHETAQHAADALHGRARGHRLGGAERRRRAWRGRRRCRTGTDAATGRGCGRGPARSRQQRRASAAAAASRRSASIAPCRPRSATPAGRTA